MGGKFGPMGEDLFAQKCMDMLGVGRQEYFALTTDGACEADRPVGQEKNTKYVPECDGVSTPSIHPFKKPDAWIQCWERPRMSPIDTAASARSSSVAQALKFESL